MTVIVRPARSRPRQRGRLTPPAAGLTRKQAAFLEALLPAVEHLQQRYALPASVVVAQAILESNWGQSRLARVAKNLFGIKAVNRHVEAITLPTVEFDPGSNRPRIVPARFAVYASYEDCLGDYARLLAFAPRYAPARAVADDPFAFAEQLEACGYATDPGYAAKISHLIRRYGLTRFDRKAETEATNRREET